MSRFTSTIQLHLYSYCRFSHRQYAGSCNTLSTLATREGLFINPSTEWYFPSPIHCSYLFRPNHPCIHTQTSFQSKHGVQTPVKKDEGDLLLREEKKGDWKRKLCHTQRSTPFPFPLSPEKVNLFITSSLHSHSPLSARDRHRSTD